MSLRSAILWLALSLPTLASAQTGTTFTYQGRLYNNGTLVNGSGYVVRVTPFAQLAGGAAIAAPVDTPPLEVVDGVFSTTLDFGAGVFTGAPVWLEIQVQAPSSSFVPLTPRQPVTPAPYAINADKVDGLDAAQLTGMQGPPGPTGIVTTATFFGQMTNPLPEANGLWTFVGPTATVEVASATQRLTGSATMAIGTGGGLASLQVGLCFRRGTNPVRNFSLFGATFVLADATITTQSVSLSTVPGFAGTYTVGPCIASVSGTINDNGAASGWVMLTN